MNALRRLWHRHSPQLFLGELLEKRWMEPIVPFALLALYRWIPKDRRILWGLAVVSSILAAASAIGIANVAQVLRRAL